MAMPIGPHSTRVMKRRRPRLRAQSSLRWPRLTRTPTRWMKMSTLEIAVRELTLAQSIKEALAEEMRRDPRVFILGEDIAEAGHPFKVLTGLVDEFGAERVLDTPISEA